MRMRQQEKKKRPNDSGASDEGVRRHRSTFQVSIAPGEKPLRVKITVTWRRPEGHVSSCAAPTSPQDADCGTVLLLQGFLQPSRFYDAYANALTAAGLAVVQYDANAVLPDDRELTVISAVLDWLKEKCQRAAREEPAASPSDSCFRAMDLMSSQSLHVMGHSRGGKLAALLLAQGIGGGRRTDEAPPSSGSRNDGGARGVETGRYEFRRALLLDPVDSAFDERFPSAVEALRGKNKTAGVIAASVSSSSNPADRNFRRFAQVLSSDSPVCAVNAGHMQLADAGPLRNALFAVLCGKGTLSTPEVVRTVAEAAATFLSGGPLLIPGTQEPAPSRSSDLSTHSLHENLESHKLHQDACDDQTQQQEGQESGQEQKIAGMAASA